MSDGPVGELHERILDDYKHRPVSYRELETRYGDDLDSFQATFASAVGHHDYRTGPETDVDVFENVNDCTLDALVGLREHLDETDSWYLRRSFRNGKSKLESYREQVPELTEEALDELYAEELLSKIGGITMVTDQGWWALYHEGSDGIYVPRER